MEDIDRKSHNASPDIPKVPIKTYRWEDVRRSRKRGAYPWTHLTKPPFDEEFDPEEYTMDAFRRSRSTSTIGKSETQDVADIEEGTQSNDKLNDETPEENLTDKENKNVTNIQKPTTSTPKLEIPPKTFQSNDNKSRAKSEEPHKKRKLSIESSHSRISLSKLQIMDKLKTVKNKLKVPKLTKRSRSDASVMKEIKKQKTDASTTSKAKSEKMQTIKDESPVYIHIPLKPPPGETDEFSKFESKSLSNSPSGSQTDVHPPIEKKRKASLLDALTQIKIAHDQHVARRASQTSDDIKKTIKLKPTSESDVHIKELSVEIREEDDAVSEEHMAEIDESVSTVPTELEESTQSDKLTIEEIDNVEIFKSDEDNRSEHEIVLKTPHTGTVDTEDSSVDDNVSQCLDKDDKYEIIHDADKPSTTEIGKNEASIDLAKVRKLEATLSKWKKQVPKAENLELPPKEIVPARARSEEPKRKRKSSIDSSYSSYSRKSLSKLAFIKKIKQAKEKIKLPNFPSFSKFDNKFKLSKEKKPTTEKVVEKQPKMVHTAHPEKPVYIHIPLKLPPGETDEFSHLEKEPATDTQVNKNEVQDVPEPDTPDTDVSENNVQLIILTPPSDDEILDSATPGTPCETDKKFFESIKIDDLKTLAKNAVDTVYPDSASVLETVKEVEDIEDSCAEGEEEQNLTEENDNLPSKHRPILVDEEDGLKLSEAAIAMINEELEKEYKQQALGLKSIIKTESSPILKKKVSFKRKSKTENGARIYEDVKLSKEDYKPPEENVVAHSVVIPLESFQSMSVDEEKSYLDKQIIKTTSLEDDYNKWSKSNDHEYEPINPPPEVVTIRGPPIIQDKAASLGKHIQPPHEDNFAQLDHEKTGSNLAVHELQKNLEDRYFHQKPTKTDTNQSISTVQSKTEVLKQSLKGSATESSKASTSSKGSVKNKRKTQPISKGFNNTLRTQAVKIKTKLQGIKRPNISLPSPPKLPTAKLKKPNFKKPNFKLPKLPDRPSIKLPSFSFTRKDSKDSWRARQFSTESNVSDSKKNIFDFRTYPRMFDKSKHKDKGASSEPSPSRPEFATVPRVSKTKTGEGSRWTDAVKDVKQTVQKDASKSVSNPDVIRIPLHSEDSMDLPSNNEFDVNVNQEYNQQNLESENKDLEYHDDHAEVAVEFTRENQEEEDEEYIPESRDEEPQFNKDFLKRWEHGEFHEGPQILNKNYIADIQNVNYLRDEEIEDVQTPIEGSVELTPPKEHSSGSLSEHRRGVLEEIDSDEFFLREKGISQEDIEVGKYLSSEIRDAFRKPISALTQTHSEDREYDLELSDQSEPVREPPRRKPLRKPKRKKTPHVSSEQISFDRESFNTEPEEYPKNFEEIDLQVLPPIRPVRKSNSKKKKKALNVDIIPYQETIPVDVDEQTNSFIHPDYTMAMNNQEEILSDNILGNDMQYFYENDFPQMYENEHMKGIEQPEIKVSDPYYRYENFHRSHEAYIDDHPPIPPTRRQRSLRSLTPSDQDSVQDEMKFNEHVLMQHVRHELPDHEYIIPTPEPPVRPRRTRSRTRSVSASQLEDDRTSRGADSLISDNQVEVTEVVEAACVKDIRDASGYAVIDKNRLRDPPLPPSRLPKTPPRTRRTKKKKTKSEDKFATVPRLPSETSPPIRPLRNYSTLRGTTPSLNEEEKENSNVVEHLQSGEVIQKMKDRPLPAPPRPPRRSRLALRDVSHERNLPNSQENFDKAEVIDDQAEIEALKQLEDQILPYDHEETVTHGSLVLQTINDSNVRSYSALANDEQSNARIVEVIREPTEITIDNKQLESTSPVLSNTQNVGDISVINQNNKDLHFSEIHEDFKNVNRFDQLIEDKDDEFSEIPESFKQLKDPLSTETVTTKEVTDLEEDSEIPPEFQDLKSPVIETPRKTVPEEFSILTDPTSEQVRGNVLHDGQEVNILRAQKLQVADLDVDRLRVNELQASKIVVSELDGISLQVSEINSKCGNLVVSGIDLPPNLIQEMLQKLQIAAEGRMESININQQPTSETKDESVVDTESVNAEQKKNSD